MKRILLTCALAVFTGPAPAQATELRILTYNVAGIPFTHPRFRSRMRRITELLAVGGYDIVGIQECWVKECSDTLKGAFPNHVRPKEGVFGGDGLLLGSQYPIQDLQTFTFSLDAPDHRLLYGEADGLTDKGIVAVTVETPAGPLKIFNTHLIAGYPGRDYIPERSGQLYELVRFIREYAGDDPYLLMGDMNFSPKMPAYAWLHALLGVRDACPTC